MAKFSDIINSEQPVLIDFFAEWCGPCKMVSPIIQEVAKETSGKVKVIKIDVDKNQALASKLGIRGVPTLMVYQNGKQKFRQAGVLQKQQILEILNPLMQ
jgi:thioredoxin 1